MLNYDTEEIVQLLMTICHEYGVDPFVPIESEAFFRELLTNYPGTPDETAFSHWLRQEVAKHFLALGERPRWIQSPEWPFAIGKPMIFAGQIDLSVQADKSLTAFFHDDTALYVFIGKKVEPVVIMQQF